MLLSRLTTCPEQLGVLGGNRVRRFHPPVPLRRLYCAVAISIGVRDALDLEIPLAGIRAHPSLTPKPLFWIGVTLVFFLLAVRLRSWLPHFTAPLSRLSAFPRGQERPYAFVSPQFASVRVRGGPTCSPLSGRARPCLGSRRGGAGSFAALRMTGGVAGLQRFAQKRHDGGVEGLGLLEVGGVAAVGDHGEA